jgi:hypothetical protein
VNESIAHAAGSFEIAGKKVARLGFGAMRLTALGVWGEPDDRAECVRVVRRAVELGVQLIDTADSYGPYVSEERADRPRAALSGGGGPAGNRLGECHVPRCSRWARSQAAGWV